ncbi:hypothetical protein HPB50_012662 [Hyalomma asiaticum]|uniref:Uncharacterized protein n=1 Tax=Hyalomma asiaticum TaxID=266040 RepID=A0ACB7T9Y7_HYAAI|nr:hypothetical protein HPB50_012662 [Hyalomma asiaticum]
MTRVRGVKTSEPRDREKFRDETPPRPSSVLRWPSKSVCYRLPVRSAFRTPRVGRPLAGPRPNRGAEPCAPHVAPSSSCARSLSAPLETGRLMHGRTGECTVGGPRPCVEDTRLRLFEWP